jgi:hypothetical protein
MAAIGSREAGDASTNPRFVRCILNWTSGFYFPVAIVEPEACSKLCPTGLLVSISSKFDRRSSTYMRIIVHGKGSD